LVRAHRKLTAAERANALRALERIPIRLEHESVSRAFGDLSELAVKESLSVYDATYLELAIRRALPLGCKDGPQRAAAVRNDVRLDP
jgi:predicted nucleic acid-binding protein